MPEGAGLQPGSTLGNYRVVSLLGQGGMGAVYEGEHTILGRKAAIKVLLPEFSHRSELVERFFNEARATARLRHKSFVEVFDSGKLPDGSAYLVMELLEGESLGAHLARRGTLPLGEALTIARFIAEGVGQAHRHGIVHRDLKPDNVFLARGTDPERSAAVAVKILDFGIAKLSGGGEQASRTQTGTLMGTPLFMAPEQCRGAGRVVIDHRADIYALGCILHAMISGQPPFPLEGLGEIIAAHLSERPPPLRTLVPDVPRPIEAFVLTLLSKSVDERPSSMDGVARELDRLGTTVGAGPVVLGAPRPGASEQPVRSQTFSTLSGAVGAHSVLAPQRSRGRWLVLAGAGGAILVAGFFAFRALNEQPSHERQGGGPAAATPEKASRPPPAPPAVPAPAVEVRPPAPPPAPAEPARVRVRIASNPPGADVLDETGARVGETPFDAMVPAGHKVARYSLRKSGYHPRDLKVKLDADAALDVVLGKKSAPAAPAPAPDDSEDERRKL